MGFKREALAQDAENQPQAEVGWLPEDPQFPSFEDAQNVHAAAVAVPTAQAPNGQEPATLINPNALDSALANAQNHYHGMFGDIGEDASPDPHERLLEAIAKMGYGIGESQAFADGNKRTTRALMEDTARANGLNHVFPEGREDPELADHLLGWGKKDENEVSRHNLQQTMDMLKQRHANGQPDESYVPIPEDDEDPRWNS